MISIQRIVPPRKRKSKENCTGHKSAYTLSLTNIRGSVCLERLLVLIRWHTLPNGLFTNVCRYNKNCKDCQHLFSINISFDIFYRQYSITPLLFTLKDI